LKQYSPRFGEAVAVAWKKADGSACGATEGVVLGTFGDEVSGQFVVIDRSTYQDSFKSALFFLNIFDLKVVPKPDVDLIKKTNVRQRPPGVSEEFTMLIEADYKSNIDFDSTILKVEKRSDCEPKRVGNSKSETYQMVIKKINILAGTTIVISCERMIQIFCKHEDLDRCINWIKEAVELLPDHKRLVLIPTKITYKINDTYKEPSRPTEEAICRIASVKGGEPVVLPIGWAHRFFAELDENPLQGMFPNDQPLENFVFEKEKREKDHAVPWRNSIEEKSQQHVDLHFPRSGVNVNKYLGADAPVMRITGIIKTPEDEESLMRMWLESRSDRWQWFENGQFHGKVIIRDLTIDKKKGVYTVDVRKYSGNEFNTASR
jgi:hypothetical protein